MKILRQFAFVLLLLLLAACSESEQKPPTASGPTAKRLEFHAVPDIPAALRSELEVFAKQFESDCRGKNTNAIRQTLDLMTMVDTVCEGIQLDETRRAQLKNGFKSGLLQSAGQLAEQWAHPQAKYKGVVLYEGNPAARFRFTPDDAGIAVLDFVLRKDAQGKVRIVNFYNHAMGYDMLQQSRQLVATMLGDLDQGFLERLLNKPNVSRADAQQFGEIARRTARQDFPGVVNAYHALSPTLRDTLPATGMYLNALQNLGDYDQYKRALKEAGARFKSASFQFMLVDAYFLDKNYDKAIECIDNFMQAVEKDAALLALKSLMINAKGDAKGARVVLLDAFNLEPDCAFAHAKGLDVLLAAKDFTAARDSMIFLEKTAGFSFKGALADPLWDEFKKAPESKQWR